MKPAELAEILAAFERRQNAYVKHIVLSPARYKTLRQEFNAVDSGLTIYSDRTQLRRGLQARVWDQEIWTLDRDDRVRLSAETRPEDDPKWVPTDLVDVSGWGLNR